VAKSSCAIMGLTVASLRRYYGTTSVKWAGYECGIISNKIEATIYLYPLSEKAAATAELGKWIHPTRLGGLGPGAELEKGDGEYGVKLTSGTHFVYIDGQAAVSQAVVIQLAHIIYRALAKHRSKRLRRGRACTVNESRCHWVPFQRNEVLPVAARHVNFIDETSPRCS
jgi:hypothetical protein